MSVIYDRRRETMTKDEKNRLNIIVISLMIGILLIGISATLTCKGGQETIEDVPCEIINDPIIQEELAEITGRICEIVDIQGNVVESFYGDFTYINEDYWGRIEYQEKGFTKIYIIIPGGKARVYSLRDEE